MKLLYPKRPLSIAVIGIPRSGSTIVGSFFNSLDGAFVVGEPHSMMNAERPFWHDLPAILATAYGKFKLYPGQDVLDQIRAFGKSHGNDIYGFKEVFTINADPIQIVKDYGSRIDITFVLFREPRRNYASLLAHKPMNGVMMSPITFVRLYQALADMCKPTLNTKIFPISYDAFIENPSKHISDATGWEFEGDVELEVFPGAGDAKAKASKKVVVSKGARQPHAGSLLQRASDVHETVLARYPYMRYE